jgi:hypothetical protein
MNAGAALVAPISAAPHTAKMAPSEAVYAARCEARALLFVNGQLSLHEAVDELQTYAEQAGLIDRIGQEEVQRIMGEAFALAEPLPDVPPPPEPEARQRPPAYRTAASTVDAFWYLISLNDLKRLKAWLANHPADAPTLLELLESK